MTDQPLDTASNDTGIDATNANSQHNQDSVQTEKLFTQEEVNSMIAKRADKMAKQKFGDIDLGEYHELKQEKEQSQRDELIRKQRFEEVLKTQKETHDIEVSNLRLQLTGVKVDGALLDAASRYGAVSPTDVAQLMKSGIKLDELGQPVVMDANGIVRYDPVTAEPMTVDKAVKEFLESKPYFRTSNPAGSGSKSPASPTKTESLGMKDLDMKNPEHRKIYAKEMDPRKTRKFHSS